MKFDYSENWESILLEDIKTTRQIEDLEYIEDKLRSKNVAKRYKRFLMGDKYA